MTPHPIIKFTASRGTFCCLKHHHYAMFVNIFPLVSVKLYTNEEDCNLPSERRKYPTPHKHEVISCLGIGGKWVTSQFDLQVRKLCLCS